MVSQVMLSIEAVSKAMGQLPKRQSRPLSEMRETLHEKPQINGCGQTNVQIDAPWCFKISLCIRLIVETPPEFPVVLPSSCHFFFLHFMKRRGTAVGLRLRFVVYLMSSSLETSTRGAEGGQDGTPTLSRELLVLL